MAGDDYFERIWAAVPQGAVPERFSLRRDFLLAHVAPGQRVLDVGCGDGAFAAALDQHGALVVGVDVAREALRRAAETYSGLALQQVTAGAPLPFDDASFDVAWCGEVLEHVVDGVGLLRELERVLVPGGRLLVTTPNHPPLRLLGLALWPRAFEEHFDPRADHLRFFTARSLALVLDTADFTAIRVRAAVGLPGRRAVLFATAARGWSR